MPDYQDLDPRNVEILGADGRVLIGKDPEGFPGLAQLRLLVNNKRYIPFWLWKSGAAWKAQYGSRKAAGKLGKKQKPDKYTKALKTHYRRLRTYKGAKLKKEIAAIKQGLDRFRIPPALQDELIRRRLKLKKKQEAQRGFKGAVKKAVAFAKKVGDIAKKGLAAAAKLAGPAIAMIYPAAGPAIKKGIKLLNGAEKGIKSARKKIKQVQTLAKAGDKRAKKALDVLHAANEIKKQVRGETPPAPGLEMARLGTKAIAAVQKQHTVRPALSTATRPQIPAAMSTPMVQPQYQPPVRKAVVYRRGGYYGRR